MMIDLEKLGAALREWQTWLTLATFAAIFYFFGRLEIALAAAAFVYSLLFRDWNLFSMDNGGPPVSRYADDDEAEAEEARGALGKFLSDPTKDFRWGRRGYDEEASPETPQPAREPAAKDHGVTVPPRKPVELPRRR